MSDPIDLLLPTERLGATVRREADGTVTTRFEVWAPTAATVAVALAGEPPRPMAPSSWPGSWEIELAGVGHGTRYRYVLDDHEPLPDPASAWQPDGVHGPSAVVDADGFGLGHTWTDQGWRGIALEQAVVYELHVGTFTTEGTFDAAADRLGALADLGVTVVELMPVNAFPGTRNWGYDGVFPGAVQASYGGPAGLARFVDAAHAQGLAVVLDVVFNHLGPEGNVLPRYGPYFTSQHRTPWGDALNIAEAGSDGVRRYLLDAARRFVVDHHVDGFRLDAVHAVVDPTANPFWEQVATVTRRAAGRRRTLVIAETSDNDPRHVRTPERGGLGLDGVWNDDLHHVLHVALTGERHDHYADYEGSAEELADVLEHRWKFRGGPSVVRGRLHGRPVDDVAPHRFVVCLQNHDQVGNRPAGDRLRIEPAARRLGTAVVLLSPFTPLLFMGEEYGETAPFPFFVDHGDPALLDAVRRGRRAEFPEAEWHADVADPADPATHRSAVLDPSLAATEPHRSLRAMYAELLRLRRDVTAVCSPAGRQRVTRHADVVVLERWLDDADDEVAVLVVGLSPTPTTSPLDLVVGDPSTARVAFDSDDPAWGGDRPGIAVRDGSVHLAGWTAGLLLAARRR